MDKKEALLKLKNCSVFHDFTIYHRGIKYQVNSLLISTISPVVSKLIFSEEPCYFIELPPLEGPIDEFISLIYGADIRLDQNNARFFNYLAKELEIVQLIDSTEELIEKTNTLDNIVRFAEQLLSCNLDATNEIDLIAGNFMEIIENPYMKLCSAKLIEKVLKTPSFKYDNIEVIKFLVSLISSNPVKYKSLEPIAFSYSSNQVSTFSVLNSTCNLKSNQNEIVYSLSKADTGYSPQAKFLLPSAKESKGLFNYAKETLQVKNLVKNNQIFEISASSELVNDKVKYGIENLIDGDKETFFSSQGSSDEYITLRVKKGTFQPTHYSFTSTKDANKGFCPESWVVEGSADGTVWLEIDSVEHDRSLVHPLKPVLYKIKTIAPVLKFIRIRQIDTCSQRNKRFILSGLEVYGILNI